MPSRTRTAYENVVALAAPDHRKFDFTESQDEPYAVRITVPKDTSFQGSEYYWTETYEVFLKCIEGRVHTYSGTGLYRNGDYFFGAGSFQLYKKFVLHHWQRALNWQLDDKKGPGVAAGDGEEGESRPLLGTDLEKGQFDRRPVGKSGTSRDGKTTAVSSDLGTPNPNDGDLVLDIWPVSESDLVTYATRHELFYRHLASVHLDAPIYPYLPTTPLLIRFLFSLPNFLFPAKIRHYLIRYFLSIQLLALFSAFDYHPELGVFPFTTIYNIIHFYKYSWPKRQFPEWVCRAQWESMIVISHVKIWIWAGIGRRIFGMAPVYEAYTPERLKHALDQIPGDKKLSDAAVDTKDMV